MATTERTRTQAPHTKQHTPAYGQPSAIVWLSLANRLGRAQTGEGFAHTSVDPVSNWISTSRTGGFGRLQEVQSPNSMAMFRPLLHELLQCLPALHGPLRRQREHDLVARQVASRLSPRPRESAEGRGCHAGTSGVARLATTRRMAKGGASLSTPTFASKPFPSRRQRRSRIAGGG